MVYFNLFIILVWIVFMGFLFWSPVKSWFFKPKFDVLSLTVERTEDKYSKSAYLLFETKNITRFGAESVRFEFKLYDADGIVVGEKTIYASNVYGDEHMKLRESLYSDNADKAVSARLMKTIVRNY